MLGAVVLVVEAALATLAVLLLVVLLADVPGVAPLVPVVLVIHVVLISGPSDVLGVMVMLAGASRARQPCAAVRRCTARRRAERSGAA
eukprot:4067153-Pyramimonas_sp.AAC.1